MSMTKRMINDFIENYNSNSNKREKRYNLTAALQAGAAYEYALFKARPLSKRPKSTKVKYVPGTIGVSSVSQAMLENLGVILSRADRKRYHRFKITKHPMRKYYNV